MTWECPCGVTNSVNRSMCAGCGWTRIKAERYKRGEFKKEIEAEEELLAKKARNKEIRNAQFATLVSLGLIPIFLAVAYYTKTDFGDILSTIIAILILICICITALCAFIVSGFKIEDD